MATRSAGPGRRATLIRALFAVVLIATGYALALAITGGFTLAIGSMRIRSQSWVRPAIVAAAGAVLLIVAARSAVAAWLERTSWILQSAGAAKCAAVVAATWALAAGLGFNTFAAGGADSYGYVGQARLLAHGRVTDTIPWSSGYTWPDAAATLTPLGFTKPRIEGVIAPIYPPGLSLLQAPLTLWSERAVYIVVPIFGTLLVWLIYRLAAHLGDPVTGAVAALLLSASPTFLYQVVQPMSDVPAAACWLAALLLAARASPTGAAASGAVASLATLIRPNLAPLAGLIAGVAALSAPASRLRRLLVFAAALAPGIALLGWIQNVRYGSPFASGYGTLADGFSLQNIGPNLSRYPRWITETHTWFIWLSLAAPVWIRRHASRPLLAWSASTLAVLTWAAYLPYAYFQPHEWFYTRFLLIAIAIMLMFASAVALSLIRRLPSRWRVQAMALMLVGLLATSIHTARSHGAFRVRDQERKYPVAGAFARARLPPTAFVLAMQHSGSIRYYANLPTLRWDILAPSHLDEVLSVLRGEGHEVFLVVDEGEYDAFRARFSASDRRALQQLTPLTVLGDTRVFAFTP
jgi:hypothetical protein